MKKTIKYLAITCVALIIATGCDIANVNETEQEKTKIVFISDMNETFDVYIANADGSNIERVTYSEEKELHPALSPDGTKIAFSKNSQIWIINIDGRDAREITRHGDAFQPSWSPDGTQLAYNKQGQIWVTDANGKNQKSITTQGNYEDINPSWSPDGTLVAYTRTLQNKASIYVNNLNTGDTKEITNSNMFSGFAAWSPTGKELIFVSGTSQDSLNLYTINARGENRAQFTELEPGHITTESFPCWATDEHIYFTKASGNTGDATKQKSINHSASRSSRSNGLVSDINTGGNTTDVTCQPFLVALNSSSALF